MEPQQHVIVLVGLPGSGKTTLSERLQSLGFVWINQDTMKNRGNCEAAAQRALAAGHSVVIDRCNFNSQQRSHWIKIAHDVCGEGVQLIALQLQVEVRECIRRIKARRGHPTLQGDKAPSVVNGMLGQWENPHFEEGFHRAIVARTNNDIDRFLSFAATLPRTPATPPPTHTPTTPFHAPGGQPTLLQAWTRAGVAAPPAAPLPPHAPPTHGQPVPYDKAATYQVPNDPHARWTRHPPPASAPPSHHQPWDSEQDRHYHQHEQQRHQQHQQPPPASDHGPRGQGHWRHHPPPSPSHDSWRHHHHPPHSPTYHHSRHHRRDDHHGHHDRHHDRHHDHQPSPAAQAPRENHHHHPPLSPNNDHHHPSPSPSQPPSRPPPSSTTAPPQPVGFAPLSRSKPLDAAGSPPVDTRPILLFDLNGTLTSHTAQRRSAGRNRLRPGPPQARGSWRGCWAASGWASSHRPRTAPSRW